MIVVHASRSPFRDDWVEAHVEPQQTVSEIVGGAPVFAWVDGREVPSEFMDRMRLKDGVTLTVRPVPEEDSTLRSVLQVVVVAVASVVGTPASGASAASAFGSYVAGATVGILGTMAINQLVPPPSQQRQDRQGGFDRLNAITGTSNQVGAFSPIPRVYGTMRFYPPIPMTAKPYTEVAGDKQFLRMGVVLGHGPLDIGGTEVGEGRSAIKRLIDTSESSDSGAADWNAGTLDDVEVNNDGHLEPINDTNPGPDQVESFSGTWTGVSRDFSADRTVIRSSVTWDSDSNDDDTSLSTDIEVEISIDGGSSWTAVNNGDPIPGLPSDLNSGADDVRARATLTGQSQQNSQGATQTVTPVLKSLNVSVRSATRNGLTGLSEAPVTIEETNIDDFEDVEYEIGRPDQMTLLTSNVTETSPGWNTTEDDDGTSAIRTTDQGATEISIDVAGRLFSVSSKRQQTTESSVLFSYEYRPTGTSDWTGPFNFRLESNKRETARTSVKFSVPEGQYDVRLTRLDTNHSSTASQIAEASWSALRTFKASPNPFDVDDMVVMTLRIQATDQLNGRIEKLATKVTSVLPVWDGSQWVEQPTRNHAWILADIITGSANRRPLSQSSIDTASFKAWADQNDTWGIYYDNVFDNTGTTLDRMNEVASMGLASWDILPDTTITVVRDVQQNTPKMVVSPRNASGFSYSLSAVEIPHALRVRYINPDTWEQTERLVFDDGFDASNATIFETLEAPGVTSAENAWKFGRYHLAQQRLRPERYSFNQDVQHLRYRRGDRILIQHDVIQVGIAAGRVKSVTTDGNGDATSITVDEFLPMDDAGKDYGVKIQRTDGTVAVVGVDTDTPGSNTVTLKTATSDIQPDDHVVFGESGLESIDAKVSAIEPSGGLQASVTAVPAADNVLDAITGDIPDFNPGIDEPLDPGALPPPVPQIDEVKSDEVVQSPDTDGNLRTRMVVEASVAGFNGWNAQFQVRYRSEGGWERTEPNGSGTFSISGIEVGADYEIQARTLRDGISSGWSPTTTHANAGVALAPEPQSVTVKETVNDPPTETGRISTLTATVEPPDPIENYDHAVVYGRLQGDSGWTEAGATDSNHQISYQVDSVGQTIEVQARSVSTRDVEDTSGPTTTITVFDPEEDNAAPPSDKERFNIPRPIRLELVDDKGNGEFTGRDPVFAWDPPAGITFYDIGQEPTAQGGGAGDSDPFFSHYLVEIVVNDSVVGTYKTRDEQFTYSFERNTQDNGGSPQREFTLRVYTVTQQNVTSEKAAFLSVHNPAPVITGESVGAVGFSTFSVGYDEPDDLDWKGTDVHVSDTSGFTPSENNRVYKGPDTSVIVEGVTPGSTKYVRLIPRDAFGAGSPTAELTATTNKPKAAEIDNLSDWATQIDPADETFITNHLTADAVDSTRIKNLTAAKITTGVVNATFQLESQGIIKADNAGSWETTMGAHTIDGTVYLHSAYDGTNVRWGVRESGVLEANGAEIEGDITVTSGSVGGVNAGSTTTGLNITSTHIGYWDGSSWTSYIDSDGNFQFQGENAGDNRISWDSGSGTLEIIGDVRTDSSGERFEIDQTDNNAKFFDSSGTERVTLGISSTGQPGIEASNPDDGAPATFTVNSGNSAGSGEFSTALRLTNGSDDNTSELISLNSGAPNAASIGLHGPYVYVSDFGGGFGVVTHSERDVDDVGQLVFAVNTDGATYNPNDTISGSNLKAADANGNSVGGGSGTYKCLGHSSSGTPTLWIKVG